MSYIPYPDSSHPNFLEIIRDKYEFSVNAYDTSAAHAFERCDFSLTPHQIALRNFISPATPYTGLLMYHGVGMGKTCTAITIAEQFKDAKVYVLVNKSTLRENFRSQVYDAAKPPHAQCTGDTYAAGLDAISDIQKKNAIAKQRVTAKYKILGSRAFANYVTKLLAYRTGTQDIERQFSGAVIVVDEAHHIRNSEDQPGGDRKLILRALEQLLGACKGVRLLLLTATPMFDAASDVIDLINLLLVNDRKPKLNPREIFADSGKLTPEGRKTFARACAPYVSFMQSDNPDIFPLTLWPSLDGSAQSTSRRDEYEFVLSVASGVQGAVLEHSETEGFQEGLQACNVVFPDRSVDFAGHFARMQGGKYRYASPDYQFLSAKHIGKHACKIKTALQAIQQCCKSNAPGIILVYSKYLDTGLVPFAIALEHAGFQRYGGNDLMQGIDRAASPMQHRYVLLSGNAALTPQMARDVEVIKSSDNCSGSKVKVVLMSDVGSEGLDLRCIRQVHVLDPWFNMSKIKQIIGRAVRRCRHYALPEPHRNVTVYLHTTIGARETADQRAWNIAFSKQEGIDKMDELLRSCAWDRPWTTSDVQNSRKMAVVTSTGAKIERHTVTCKSLPALPKGAAAQRKLDKSTYDPFRHCYPVSVYKPIVLSFLAEAKKTAPEVIAEVSRKFLMYDTNAVLLALTLLIKAGIVQNVSDKYRIAETPKWNLEDFGWREATVESAKASSSASGSAAYGTGVAMSQPTLKQLASSALSSSEIFIDYALTNACAVLKLSRDNESMKSLLPWVVDYHVDRLHPDRQLKMVKLLFQRRASMDSNDKLLMQRLVQGQVLIAAGSNAWFCYNYVTGAYVACTENDAYDEITDAAKTSHRQSLLRAAKGVAFIQYDPDIAKLRGNNNAAAFSFKVITEKNKAGSICQQTSNITAAEIRDMIKSNDANNKLLSDEELSYVLDLDAALPPNKKQLCMLYEIVLRSSDNITRPPILKGIRARDT